MGRDLVPIAVALLGCGHPHVPDALGVIASEPDLRLAAAWDADRSAVPGQIANYAVDSLDVAIRRADAVVISVPTDQRPEVAVRAARAGRPILIEKPVAITAAEARLTAAEIARSRTPAVAALHLRQLPALGRLREVLRAGLVGRPAAVSGAYVHAGALTGLLAGPAGWMLDRRRAGTGALTDLGLHLVDALAALGATPRLTAATVDPGPAGSPELGGTAIGRWGDVPLSVRASWVTRPAGLELTVAGATATAVLREGTLEILAGDGTRERWVGAPPDAGESLRAFATGLRGRRLPRDGLERAIRAQEALERAVGLD